MLFSGAVGTYTLDDVVDRLGRETFGKSDMRDGYAAQAEGTVAAGTVEVRMQIVDFTVALGAAEGIFERARSVVDSVYDVMGQKECKGTEQGRFIDRIESLLQVGETECPIEFGHRAKDENPKRSRTYVAFLQQFYLFIFLHIL